jgi:hypothetical protein
MGGTIFQKEGVKVTITPSKVKATAGTKETNQKMTFKVKTKTQKRTMKKN